MAKIINFPVDRVAKGTHIYYPELNERMPKCQMEASLSHDGRHYFIDTPFTLRGRGIQLIKQYTSNDFYPESQYKAGWFCYEVTIRAYEKLNHDFSFSKKILLD